MCKPTPTVALKLNGAREDVSVFSIDAFKAWTGQCRECTRVDEPLQQKQDDRSGTHGKDDHVYFEKERGRVRGAVVGPARARESLSV